MPSPWRNRPFPWVPILVALGLALRAYQYLSNPSMWHDEAALVLNVLDKGFVELLGPLRFSEAAPPLFLWIERAVCLGLGETTFALRLIPFLASCAALSLFVPLARRLLPPTAVAWGVFLFACSDKLLWHCCEAKPYAVDVLGATLLALVFVQTRDWEPRLRLGCFVLLCPLLIFLTYPGCFLAGGLLVALLPEVWQGRRWHLWALYGVLVLAVFLSFGLLLAGPVRVQRDSTILDAWEGSFPDWTRPWSVPWWTLMATLELHRYCSDPAGPLLAILTVVGAAALWRQGQRGIVALLIVPIALPWFASWVRAYPFGGARVLVYAAPALFLLIAAGLVPVQEWLRSRVRLATGLIVLVLLLPAARVAQHLIVPSPRADCAGAAAYVLRHRQPTEIVLANHWEYFYYFRHLGPFLTPLEGPIEAKSDSRVWMVFTDAREEVRTQTAQAWVPRHWRLLDERHFARTTVFLFQPVALSNVTASVQRAARSEPPHSRP